MRRCPKRKSPNGRPDTRSVTATATISGAGSSLHREIRRSRQGYYGSVTHVDEQIGRILEALEKRGWLEETLISSRPTTAI